PFPPPRGKRTTGPPPPPPAFGFDSLTLTVGLNVAIENSLRVVRCLLLAHLLPTPMIIKAQHTTNDEQLTNPSMPRHPCCGRIGLHDVIPGRTRHTVLIGSMVDHRRLATEIVVRRRSRGGPFQRGGLPGVVAGLLAFAHAPEEIDDENQL